MLKNWQEPLFSIQHYKRSYLQLHRNCDYLLFPSDEHGRSVEVLLVGFLPLVLDLLLLPVQIRNLQRAHEMGRDGA